jgi:hypothetical protein
MGSFAKVLSFPEEHFSKKVSSSPILDERRLRFRYPLDLRVRFQSSAAGAPLAGAGLAVNVSSGGVFVASNHPVMVGAWLSSSIEQLLCSWLQLAEVDAKPQRG